MRFVRVMVLLALVGLTSSCTVLGFTGDVAAQLALAAICSDCNDSPGINGKLETNQDNNGAAQPWTLTKKGLEADKKVVEEWRKKQREKHADTKPAQDEIQKPLILVCGDVVEGKQQCYSSDYYKDMYITEETESDE